ncbi:uncharacterized protein LOC103577996 isoform X2 [Microplitis demolitor]|uniref:uncharacterized protein LOC103577996 isoform X2 n=1 Tax=Microplitis demolitor TaxID=69319 RepID=UPI0004CDBB41|nr:uncharacterized protein LOC103577996 isoform X2 [Microplitis demolitor]
MLSTLMDQCAIVTACVKQPFRLITSYSASYDGGVAVDGEYRLRVKSAKYDSEVSYSKGHFISFRCESFFDYHGIPGLSIRSTEDIEYLDSPAPITEEVLRDTGFTTPKCKLEESSEENTKKQIPLDE